MSTLPATATVIAPPALRSALFTEAPIPASSPPTAAMTTFIAAPMDAPVPTPHRVSPAATTA